MLTYDPEDRITINNALAHPYLSQLHYPDDEPVMGEIVSAYDFDFEKFNLTKDDFKELIYEAASTPLSIIQTICDVSSHVEFYNKSLYNNIFCSIDLAILVPNNFSPDLLFQKGVPSST